MEYRHLPHGAERENFSALGLGMGSIQHSGDAEIEDTVQSAIARGINYFDLCAADRHVYAPFGRAIAGQWDKVFFQLHLGAVYDQKGAYGWSRDPAVIRRTWEWELKTLATDHADMGFLHCVDDLEDWEEIKSNGLLDYLKRLRENGVVHHIGFSSHTPLVAERIIDTGLVDMMMFSINPAYDFELGDDCGKGTVSERTALFSRCQAEGIGISVMKPFHAGQLLDAKTSVFHRQLTKYQCLQYALDRPGVLTVLPGARGLSDVKELLQFVQSSAEQRDYAEIGTFTAAAVRGTCVYCHHCQPCPAGIDIGLVNKYYDLARAGDPLAAGHYDKLTVKAADCVRCSHCDKRCPFGVKQSDRMKEISEYFSTLKA